MLFLELTDIKGVGKSTARKLEKVGYHSLHDFEGVTINKLTEIGVRHDNAEKIVASVERTLSTHPTNDDDDSEIQNHIADANKFRLHAFKQSTLYNPDNPEKSYDTWWKQVLKKHQEVNHG